MNLTSRGLTPLFQVQVNGESRASQATGEVQGAVEVVGGCREGRKAWELKFIVS